MNEPWIFELITVTRKEKNIYDVVGLVFHTIKIGDVLTITVEIEDVVKECKFEVIEIYMYGHYFDEIERGSGCQLTLKGDGGDYLNQRKYLYKDTPE